MTPSLGLAPTPTSAPVPRDTRVRLDPGVRLLDERYVAGGSPWRLLTVPVEGRSLLEKWRDGGVVGPGQERFARTLINQGIVHPVYPPAADISQIDVIIPVLDDTAGLALLLPSLAGFAVTVVDDGSRNPTAVADIAAHFGAKLLRRDVNEGPAAARNAGDAATTRPLVWFLDVDVQLDDALATIASLQPWCDDPLVAAVAPRVRGPQGQRAREHFEEVASPLDLGPLPALVCPGSAVPYVPSACLLVRRSALGEGFDESLRVGEDVDLIWRLTDAGWLVRYDPSVVVRHPARATWAAWWRQRFAYGQSAGELATRHGPRLAPLRTDRPTALAWLALWWGQPAIALRVFARARRRIAEQLEAATEPDATSLRLMLHGPLRAGGYMARAAVRTFGPLLLVAAVHPRLRRRALAVWAFGTAWRWRRQAPHPTDVALGVADDLAYSAGVARGAWRRRTWVPLKPILTAGVRRPKP